MNKLSGKKIFLIALISIIVLYNISWFLITTIKYHPYIEVVPKNAYGYNGLTKDGYCYNVKKPSYLSFTGNLGVTSQKNDFSLIIWPSLFRGYDYGVRIQEGDTAYEIYVNANLEPIKNEDEYYKKLLEKYKSEISILFSNANEMWDLQ